MSSRRAKKYVSLGFMGDLRLSVNDLNRKSTPEHKAAVLFLITVGVVLRVLLLHVPVAYLEATTYIDFATLPITKLVSDYSFPTNHVLNTLLVKASTALFGVGLWQVRLPGLIANVLCMPLFYLFVRAMFNRYIAVISLAIVAASGPLLTTSVAGIGYNLCWFFFVSSLLLGRHFIKSNNVKSALLIALASAFGLWVMPSYAYAALAIYVWLLVALIMAYKHSLRERVLRLVFSLIMFIVMALILYSPILQEQGFDQLTNHHTHPRLDWRIFDLKHTDMAFALWSLAVDSTSGWTTGLGLIGLLYAAFTSSKLRALLFAIFVSGVALGLLMRRMEPVDTWGYTFFVFHLSSGITVFYLLKFLQEKVFPNWGKRARTAVASLLLLVVFGWPGYEHAVEMNYGMPQAHLAAELVKDRLKPGDKLYVQHPWDAPIQFTTLSMNVDQAYLNGSPTPGGRVMVAVGLRPEQSVDGVLRANGQDAAQWPGLHEVEDWKGLKIFAAP
ncbi:MAG: glycosyltransferase family 39 protein [Flavobacteriales bacterium]|nr:glycosyltransferase family 39 protein [Flavobacteriales bacterium]